MFDVAPSEPAFAVDEADDQTTPPLEHPARLRQHGVYIVDEADSRHCEHEIECVVGKGEGLRDTAHDDDAAFARPP